MKGDNMSVTILFLASLGLMVAAVFIYIKREDNDFVKLNSSVREMVNESKVVVEKSEESLTTVESFKLMIEEMKIKASDLESRIIRLEKDGKQVTVQLSNSKPFMVEIVEKKPQVPAIELKSLKNLKKRETR